MSAHAVARLQPSDDYFAASRRRIIKHLYSSARGRVIMVTRLEPSDCDYMKQVQHDI